MTDPTACTYEEYKELTRQFLEAPGGLIQRGGTYDPHSESATLAELLADIEEEHPEYEERLANDDAQTDVGLSDLVAEADDVMLSDAEINSLYDDSIDPDFEFAGYRYHV